MIQLGYGNSMLLAKITQLLWNIEKLIINLSEIKFIIIKMRKLKYSHKLKKETDAFTEMINIFVKKMNKEYACNMNKLIELIARGENLDVTRLKEKYLESFKSNSDNDENDENDNDSSTKTTSNTIITSDINDVYLDKIIINDSEYWYENKESGNVYYNNCIVGTYKNSNFEINGKKYNSNLELIK